MDIYNTLHLDSNRNPFMIMASEKDHVESRIMLMSLTCCDLLKKNKKVLVLLTEHSVFKFKNYLYSNLGSEFFTYEKQIILKDIRQKYCFNEMELYIKYFLDRGEKFDYILFDEIRGSQNYMENNYGQLILETKNYLTTHEVIKEFNIHLNTYDFFCSAWKEVCIEYDVNIIIGCNSRGRVPTPVVQNIPTSVLWVNCENIVNQSNQNEQFYKLKIEYSKHPSKEVTLMPKTLYLDKISGILIEDTKVFYNKIFVKS